MSRTLVIAEPGCTARGRYEDMVRLIHVTAAAGADVFKPGWTSDPVRMCERRHIGPDHPKRAYYEQAYGWLAWPVEWHEDFARLTRQLGLQYACTSFLPQDCAVLARHANFLKISSFEVHDREMREAAYLAMPYEFPRQSAVRVSRVVVSLGMTGSNVPELRYWAGADTVPVGLVACYAPMAILHCTSAYPAPLESLNLNVISGAGRYDGDSGYAGLSDHSRNVLTGAVAVGAGASIIETHIRLDDCDPENPDYAVAFSPREFAQYVANIRTAEQMMGDGEKRVQPCEEWALPYRVTHA